jgi:hypothetical protein
MATEGSWKINARVRQRLHPHNLHSVTASFIATFISVATGSFIAYVFSAFKWGCRHTIGVESSHVKRIGLDEMSKGNIIFPLNSTLLMQCSKETYFPIWRRSHDRLGVMEFGNCARSPRVLMTTAHLQHILAGAQLLLHKFTGVSTLTIYIPLSSDRFTHWFYACLMTVEFLWEFKAPNVLDQDWNFFYKLRLIKAELLFTYR